MTKKEYLNKLSKVLDLTIYKGKLNTRKEGLPYLGTFNSHLFEADLFISMKQKVAKLYIELINRDLPLHIVDELSWTVWKYYNENRNLFIPRKNRYQVALVQPFGVYLLINIEHMPNMLLNIRKSIYSLDLCSKYIKIGYCNCEVCAYRLFKRNRSAVVIDFVTMPKRGVDRLFDKFKPELKGIKVEEWLTD